METQVVRVGIADEINAAHAECEGAARNAIEQAIRVGELLIEAKAAVNHGEWIPWVEANLTFAHRQAQRYMRVAQRVEIGNASPGTHLKDALKALAEPKERKEKPPVPQVPDFASDTEVRAVDDIVSSVEALTVIVADKAKRWSRGSLNRIAEAAEALRTEATRRVR